MTEGRRAQSAGGSVPPTTRLDGEPPESLEDVDVEEVPPSQAPTLQTKVVSEARARDALAERRRGRARMALRIPDDEVNRPTIPSAPPSTPPAIEDAPPLKPTRIITIEPPPPELAARAPVIPAAPAPPSTDIELPTLVDEPLTRPRLPEEPWNPSSTATGAFETFRQRSWDESSRPSADRGRAPSSEELIPIESADGESAPETGAHTDSGEVLDMDDVEQPPSSIPSRDPMPSMSEEIALDDDAPAPATVSDPPPSSMPSEVPEIAPEDLVSVESVPREVAQRAATSAAAALTTPVAQAAPAPAPAAAKPASPNGPAAAAAAVASAPQPAAPLPTPRPPLVIVPPHLGVAAPPQEATGVRRKARPWWEELFNDDFIRTMAKITDEQIARESDFIEDSLGVARGGTILDLACGTGRHAIELSRRGYEVVGFDLSLAMLARAADEAQERDQKLNLIQGDAREMTFEEAFDGIYCWNTSFGFFEEEKNVMVVQRIHRALRTGGQFLLDVVNRDYIIRQAPSLAWFEGEGCVCMDEMQIDWITSRMRVKRTMMMDDGRSREIEYTIRVYSIHELGKLLHDSGFRVCEVSGRTSSPGVFFGNESPRVLVLAEKR